MSHWCYVNTLKCPTCSRDECLLEMSISGGYGFNWTEGTPIKEALVEADKIIANLGPTAKAHYEGSRWPEFWSKAREIAKDHPDAVVVIH